MAGVCFAGFPLAGLGFAGAGLDGVPVFGVTLAGVLLAGVGFAGAGFVGALLELVSLGDGVLAGALLASCLVVNFFDVDPVFPAGFMPGFNSIDDVVSNNES